jgi:hypothetical protein
MKVSDLGAYDEIHMKVSDLGAYDEILGYDLLKPRSSMNRYWEHKAMRTRYLS